MSSLKVKGVHIVKSELLILCFLLPFSFKGFKSALPLISCLLRMEEVLGWTQAISLFR